jgi:hypothetical protein
VAAASVTDVDVSSGPTPSLLGGAVIFTARVKATTGTVTFGDNGVAAGTAPVLPDALPGYGVAKLTLTTLPIGSHRVTAHFSGAPNYTDAASSTSAIQEVRGATSATLGVAPSPSRNGETVTLTCTVASAAGIPTGSVTFLDGGTAIGTASAPAPATSTSATWTLGIATLAPGSHSLSCAYARQGFFEGSTSAGVTHLVGPLPTTTSVSAAPSTVAYGSAVTLTATVAAAVGTPTGTVTFSTTTPIGTRTWGPAPLGANGVATVVDSTLDVGTYAFQASYSGDSLYAASTGTTATSVNVTSAWAFTGFLTPLKTAGTYASPTYSGTQKLGSAIPVKWQLKDKNGAYVSDLGTLKSLLAYPVACSPLGPPSGVTPLVLYVIPGGATGNSTFRYATSTFIFNWDTTNGVSAGCFDLVLTLKDGTVKSTIVKLQ